MAPFELRQGTSPIILAFPHAGTWVPQDVAHRLNEEGRLLRDTDWHVDRLYEGLVPAASVLRATFHRYVIDANRDPAGVSLYPGQTTTGLIPLTTFDGAPIWHEDARPRKGDVAGRLQHFHAPYHAALAALIERVRALHGVAVVHDCHSIRSVIPHLFEGRLPDLNIGTDGGRTCAPAIEAAAVGICAAAEGYSSVLNGRFRGGWTTRHHGRPEANVHAIQLELAQATHLRAEAPPFDFDSERAEGLRRLLRAHLARLEAVAVTLASGRT